MTYPSDNPDDNQFKLEHLLFGLLALKGVSETSKAIKNSNRQDTALESFENQNLGFLTSWHMESWFESRDFYITQFPDTPKEIFPLAAKILYKLFKYHSKWYLDSWLGYEILNDCAKVNKIANRNEFYPIARDWPYWKLVQKEEYVETFFGKKKIQRKFIQNSEWNLNNFLNDFAGGMIRYGLFGIQSNKRIDVCIYKKKFLGLGKLTDAKELVESEKTLKNVWDVKNQWNWVAKIYDPRWELWNRSRGEIPIQDLPPAIIAESICNWKAKKKSSIIPQIYQNAERNFKIVKYPVYHGFKNDEINYSSKRGRGSFRVYLPKEDRAISCATSLKNKFIRTFIENEGIEYMYVLVYYPSTLMIKQQGNDDTHCSILPIDINMPIEEYIIEMKKAKWRRIQIISD